VSRPWTAAIAAAAVALVLLGAFVALSSGGQSSDDRNTEAFAWLRPAAPPASWKVARISGGATLPFPPGWRPLKSDPGSATVALLRGGKTIASYLNATPKQGTETLANWRNFRPDHNRDEGDRSVHLIASATGLPFRSGRGSCVIDDYTTSRATYREIACLVAGRTSSAVVVAAAPRREWGVQVATLRRAVSGFAP
jgi:hypothetical protein